MATNTFVHIDLPEAADLADLTGISQDLCSARDFAGMLRKVFEAERPDYSMVDPLSSAILVRYSRAFVSGVRKKLGEEALRVLNPEQRAKHERLRAFRDKHIAHSVNAFEENQPVARYWLERVEQEGITSIECIHNRIVGLSSEGVRAVEELTSVMLKHVEGRLKEEKARILALVRSKPLTEILEGKDNGHFRPDLQAIDKRRPR